MNTTHDLVKGKDLIGMKVVGMQKGQLIDEVREIVYDPREAKVKAFVVDKGGWFTDAKVILYDEIRTIGKDMLIVDSEQVVKKASDVQERITRIIKDDTYLTSTKVVTESGTELGNVSDIYFDPTTGNVIEMEVSQGTIKNAQSGKKRVNISDVVKIGEDVTIVRSFVDEKVQQQAKRQGLQGIAASIGEKTPELINQGKQKSQDLFQQSKEKMYEVKNDPKTHDMVERVKQKAEKIKESVSQKMEQGKEQVQTERKKAAVGQYLTVNILTSHDEMLAQRGEMITHQLLQDAENAEVLEQVLQNVSSSPLPATDSLDSQPTTDELETTIDNQLNK